MNTKARQRVLNEGYLKDKLKAKIVFEYNRRHDMYTVKQLYNTLIYSVAARLTKDEVERIIESGDIEVVIK